MWRIVATRGGVPVGAAWLASPGAVRDGAALLRDALGEPPPAPPPPARGDAPPLRVSVVVCTDGRRPLGPLLARLKALDPPPGELIVVDNRPPAPGLEALVRAAGARYVAEPARGLDCARNAGLLAAAGDVVAYTDDDCLPPSSWLAALPAAFAAPQVVAVTGPAPAQTMRTAAQLRLELAGGFVRGWARELHTPGNRPPTGAAAVGVGAAMAVRRAALHEIGGFAPELDAGTPARSGGDVLALAQLLRRGGHVLYEPAFWVWHRHREDPAELADAVAGYGTGTVAALVHQLVLDGDRRALRVLARLPRSYLRAVAGRAAGTRSAGEQRLAWHYFRGACAGPLAWLVARARVPAGAPVPGPFEPRPPIPATPPGSPAPPRHAAAAAPEPGGTWTPVALAALDDVARAWLPRAQDGDRVAVTLCARGERETLSLVNRLLLPQRLPRRDPPAVAVLRDDLVERLGGLDPALMPHAAALELAERALDAGLTVAYRTSPALPPGDARLHARARATVARRFGPLALARVLLGL